MTGELSRVHGAGEDPVAASGGRFAPHVAWPGSPKDQTLFFASLLVRA